VGECRYDEHHRVSNTTSRRASAVAAHREQDLRRALEAYHFFYPTVSMEAIARGTRAAGAADNKAALLVVAEPRHVGFTLNSDTPYAGRPS